MPDFYVTKLNGERELFDHGKFESSLRRTGVDEKIIADIVHEIKDNVFDGITTSEIYRKAYDILRRKHRPAAIRYSLKQAVATLGPTGFPFEKFIAEIFKAEGYETLTDQIVKGKCVEHEIDVVAWKNDRLIMAEAKFHTDFNMKSDLKIALYVKARYDDIFLKKYGFGGQERELSEGWLITNTKFSLTAVEYAECQVGYRLLGWNYPYDNDLHHLIEKYGLIPLTALTTISNLEKNEFLSKGIVLSKSLLDEKLLKDMNFNDEKIQEIKAEVADLTAHIEAHYEKRRV